MLAVLLALASSAHAQQLTVSRGAITVMVEPYADNVVRVSISTLKDRATAAPGYGISAQPARRPDGPPNPTQPVTSCAPLA